MNETLLSINRTLLVTARTVTRGTTSRIPYREQVLIDVFNTYIQIGFGSLLFLFGLTFNCLSLIYFRASRSFRNTTFQLYFSIIALLDTIRLFEFFIFILFDKGYLRVTIILCRWVFFTIMFTGQASIWLTVALAVEKCIIIWFPIKGRLCFTIAISKVVLVLVLCLVFFANVIYLLPKFFLHAYENTSIHTFMCVWQTGGRSSKTKYEQWKKHYFTFNTIFFHSIIPSVLLLVINWLILYSLSRHRITLSKIGSIDARHVLKREKQFKEKTIQLVLSSFFVIVTISPRYVLTMVNAFATSITKVPLMPLYIYVNLNIVFRVLEMSNYSLNLMFAIMSGRTSRREIRKLLRECLCSRFKRAKANRLGSKVHTHSLLFDDDDDEAERSLTTTAGAAKTPYSSLGIHGKTRRDPIGQHDSSGNYSIPNSRRSSFYTCCGFTIDVSNKHSSCSSNGDTSSRRSTIFKSTANHSPRRIRASSQSPMSVSISPFDRHSRYQNSNCYKSTDGNNRLMNRPRATTVVHCLGHLPSSTMISLTNTHSTSICRSRSKEKECSSAETLPLNTSNSPPPSIEPVVNNANINRTDEITDSSVFLHNHFDEQKQLPAYIVEKC